MEKMKDINRNLALLPAFLKPLKTSNGKFRITVIWNRRFLFQKQQQ